MDYKGAWNLSQEVQARLGGKNEAEFARDLNLFLKGQLMTPAGVVSLSKKQDVYPVVVDYDMPLDKMIAAGNYNWINKSITAERFPIIGKGKVDTVLHLFRIGREVNKIEAIIEISRNNLFPTTLPELLAFGAQHPNALPKKLAVFALAAVWNDSFEGHNYVTVGLCRIIPGRGVFARVGTDDTCFGSHCLFLASEK